MLVNLVTILLLPCTVVVDAGVCHGGYKEGQIVDKGRYWYECTNGQLIQKGCLTENNHGISVGETYDSNGYRMQCTKDKDGYLTFTLKSCVYNGREYGPDEKWDDVKYWYKCMRDGDQLRIEVAGCLDQGRRINIQQKITKGSFVYQCLKHSNGTCSMCPSGCANDNREYGIGESFERQGYLYTCTKHPRNDRKITIMPIGCVNDGARVYDDGRFHNADTVYQCYAREGDVKKMVVGCVVRESSGTVERSLGDRWYEGQSPYRYEMTCLGNKADTAASKTRIGCQYDVTQGQFDIQPGCYRMVDKTAIGCFKDGSNSLQIRAFQGENVDQLSGMGLRKC